MNERLRQKQIQNIERYIQEIEVEQLLSADEVKKVINDIATIKTDIDAIKHLIAILLDQQEDAANNLEKEMGLTKMITTKLQDDKD